MVHCSSHDFFFPFVPSMWILMQRSSKPIPTYCARETQYLSRRVSRNRMGLYCGGCTLGKERRVQVSEVQHGRKQMRRVLFLEHANTAQCVPFGRTPCQINAVILHLALVASHGTPNYVTCFKTGCYRDGTQSGSLLPILVICCKCLQCRRFNIGRKFDYG